MKTFAEKLALLELRASIKIAKRLLQYKKCSGSDAFRVPEHLEFNFNNEENKCIKFISVIDSGDLVFLDEDFKVYDRYDIKTEYLFEIADNL